jgi:hypothetical protein
MDQVSEDQGLPIAHANGIALTRSFVLGPAWRPFALVLSGAYWRR